MPLSLSVPTIRVHLIYSIVSLNKSNCKLISYKFIWMSSHTWKTSDVRVHHILFPPWWPMVWWSKDLLETMKQFKTQFVQLTLFGDPNTGHRNERIRNTITIRFTHLQLRLGVWSETQLAKKFVCSRNNYKSMTIRIF